MRIEIVKEPPRSREMNGREWMTNEIPVDITKIIYTMRQSDG